VGFHFFPFFSDGMSQTTDSTGVTKFDRWEWCTEVCREISTAFSFVGSLLRGSVCRCGDSASRVLPGEKTIVSKGAVLLERTLRMMASAQTHPTFSIIEATPGWYDQAPS